MESYWSNTSDLCQIRSVTLFCRIKKSLIRNVPVQVFVQLSEQLTLGVAKLAVAGGPECWIPGGRGAACTGSQDCTVVVAWPTAVCMVLAVL